jgi:excinuclease ABC subunit B
MNDDVDPFDLSKALEGAAKAHLDPSISKFDLHSEYGMAGDQESAIEKTLSQLRDSQSRCVMLGVTGSGKTFAMANIIQALNIPTLILSHNKTLSRQLWQEMSGLFPKNAVEYFVSHYDYYQPEAYLPKRDLYIEKELSLNERIEQERFSTVASLVSRPDVLVVATVSAIYGLNPPEAFLQQHVRLHVGQQVEPQEVVKQLVALQYRRVTGEITRGELRLRGEVLDVWMPSRDDPIRIQFDLDGIIRIQVCESVSWEEVDEIEEVWIHPKEFFMTSPERFERALEDIEFELEQRLDFFEKAGKELEAHRLETKTRYDLDLLREIGHCRSVENYSMHFDGRNHGMRPYCLLDFFAACALTFHGSKEKYLVIMDESHVTLPQLGGMYHGDRARKENLIEHGFRLPSAADNRPLKGHEFQELVPQMLYVSATPGERELRQLCEVTGQPMQESDPKEKRKPLLKDALGEIKGISRMEIRPTGLLDPSIEVRPTEGQVQDLLDEINACTAKNERTLVTVMTIKFAEEVADYLQRMGVKAHYLHSEIDTLERSEIIKALRIGHIDVIVGINLLREGLDIPEVSLVAIFDADKEGFLRNERSLLQTIGRASRNQNGRVILYADSMGRAMESAITQTIERREKQMAHNEANGITPTTIEKPLPVMGIEAEQLLSGTAGKGVTGGKRFVGSFTNKTGKGKETDLVKKFNLGAGSWGDDVVSNLSQPSEEYILEEDDSELQIIEKLRKEMNGAAERLDFEKAAKLRDRIFQLENLNSN